MATRRDLVEAQAFGRRRLVGALVTGTADPEVEPARPGRAVGGGLALATLLVAGAAVAGLLLGRAPAGWDQPGLLVSEDTGSLYVIVDPDDPDPHAVPNVTSARLILGADAAPTVLPEATIAGRDRGADLGIPGAPASVPEPGRLVDTGWSACASGAGGLAVTVAAEAGVRPVVGGGVTVRSEGRYYVVATAPERYDEPSQARRYALPVGAEPDPLLHALGLPIAADARDVPARWLQLFPAGGDLDLATLGLQGYGDPAPQQGPGMLPVGARIGQLVTLDGTSVQVLTAAGPADLDPFALALYRAVAKPALAVPVDLDPVRLDAAPQVRAAPPPYAGARWPDRLPQGDVGEPCALLATDPDGEPATLLATDPTDAAAAAGFATTRVTVEPGRGAHVRAGDRELLVTAPGTAFPLADAEAVESLGLGAHDPPLVPEPWIGLFDEGVVLSRHAALSPP